METDRGEFSISDLAREFDVTPRAIRFYEDQGLLAPRRDGQRRIYTPRDRTRLKLTLRGKRLGLSLSEIRELIDMFYDGLEDAYIRDEKGGGRLMGTFAEECAQKYNFSREAQDRFAITSLERAQKANKEGWFAWETTPIAIKAGKDEKFVETDEQPFKANLEKIPTLRPAFRKDGTVTAANSSSISDGAAALVMMRRSTAERRGLAPLAVVMARRYFLTAEVFGAEEAHRIGLLSALVSTADLDTEVNSLVKHLLAGGPQAHVKIKDLIRAVTGRQIDAALSADTAKRIAEIRVSPEGREGIASFLEKRKASWCSPKS